MDLINMYLIQTNIKNKKSYYDLCDKLYKNKSIII